VVTVSLSCLVSVNTPSAVLKLAEVNSVFNAEVAEFAAAVADASAASACAVISSNKELSAMSPTLPTPINIAKKYSCLK